MSFEPGTRLGPYELLGPIGAGGMGQVHKARDTRLDRTVAIKVIAPQFAANADLRQRFEREARAVSHLNHPHICTLFDIGREGDVDYLVIEYLEGETLEARLTRGALPPDETLAIATQIADALDQAHRQGVVHRDLKPGNVMLTRGGAKLLDFGLAKPIQAGSPAAAMTASPTRTSPLTLEGVVLGTFQYMAPEQLEGQDASARSDIFAFGALVYEMATGRRAFAGKTQASVIAAILERQPQPLAEAQPLAPPGLDRLIRECLAKDPEDRRQSMHDVLLDLRWIAEARADSTEGIEPGRSARSSSAVAVVSSIVALASIVVALWVGLQDGGPPGGPLRLEIVPPEGRNVAGGDVQPIALSPDGSRVALVLADGLWVRSLASHDARRIEEGGVLHPFWSPDGRSLGFFADGSLKVADLEQGASRTLCDVPGGGRGGAWNEEGTILIGSRRGLYQIPATGGEPVAVPQMNGRLPRFLPDGRRFLLVNVDNGLIAGSLDSDETTVLLESGSNVDLAGGMLFYMSDGDLVAQRFDAERLALEGAPIIVADAVEYAPFRFVGNFSVSRNGVIAYRQRTTVQSELAWLSWIEKPERITLEPESIDIGKLELPIEPSRFQNGGPRVSPDGQSIVAPRMDPNSGLWDVWLIDLRRDASSRLSFARAPWGTVVWGADGRRVAWRLSGRDEKTNVLEIGHKEPEVWSDAAPGGIIHDWAPGQGLLMAIQRLDTSFDLVVVDRDGREHDVVNSPFSDFGARISPSGTHMVYCSLESGRAELYVTDFPNAAAKWPISTTGVADPCPMTWSRDGSRIYFVDRQRGLWAVDVETSGTFRASKPRGGMDLDRPVYSLDAAPDGRLLAWWQVGEPTSQPIRISVNALAGIQARAGGAED